MDAPFTIFGKTRLVPVVTYTNGHRDDPPRESWRDTLWVERGEDYYALTSNSGTMRVVERSVWLRSPAVQTEDE